MERTRSFDLKCAALFCLILAAVFDCSDAGRMRQTNGRFALDSSKSLNAVAKLRAQRLGRRWVSRKELLGGDDLIFAMDYNHNPGGPRPVPAAPTGQTPKIGVSPPPAEYIVAPPPPSPPPPLLPMPPPLPPLDIPPLPNPFAPPPPPG
ncbi:hypothetical protein R1flu_013935 [Riccia fluitans]|uniref:Uncharacterized protein n=1 Tax=Riccia fluitans TaxID=41844 RepID=A0ABD1YFS6_9MARC